MKKSKIKSEIFKELLGKKQGPHTSRKERKLDRRSKDAKRDKEESTGYEGDNEDI